MTPQKPRSWREIEEDEQFQALDPERKLQVLTRWSDRARDYGSALGSPSDSDDFSKLDAFRQQKEQQISGLLKEPEPVDKPFFGVGDTFSALGQAAGDLVTGVPASVYRLSEGLERPDKYSESAKAAFEAERKRAEETQAEQERRDAEGASTDVGDAIRQAGKSLGFTAANMAVAIPAGAAAGAVAGAAFPPAEAATIPVATVASMVGVGLASGPAAYRMAGNQFLYDSFGEIERNKGSALTEEEKQKAYEILLPIAQNTALWEAGPEAIGNAVTFGVGKFVFGFGGDVATSLATKALTKTGAGVGKDVAKVAAAGALKAAGKTATPELVETVASTALKEAGKTTFRKTVEKAGAALADLSVELGGETITQTKQGYDDAKARQYAMTGSTEGAVNEYEGLAGLGKAFKEVAPATLATMGIMGGAAGAVKVASNALPNKRAENEEKVTDLIAGTALMSEKLKAEGAPMTADVLKEKAANLSQEPGIDTTPREESILNQVDDLDEELVPEKEPSVEEEKVVPKDEPRRITAEEFLADEPLPPPIEEPVEEKVVPKDEPTEEELAAEEEPPVEEEKPVEETALEPVAQEEEAVVEEDAVPVEETVAVEEQPTTPEPVAETETEPVVEAETTQPVAEPVVIEEQPAQPPTPAPLPPELSAPTAEAQAYEDSLVEQSRNAGTRVAGVTNLGIKEAIQGKGWYPKANVNKVAKEIKERVQRRLEAEGPVAPAPQTAAPLPEGANDLIAETRRKMAVPSSAAINQRFGQAPVEQRQAVRREAAKQVASDLGIDYSDELDFAKDFDGNDNLPIRVTQTGTEPVFVNNAEVTARQIDAGFTPTIPEGLRGRVVEGIAFDAATGQVTSSVARGVTTTQPGQLASAVRAQRPGSERIATLATPEIRKNAQPIFKKLNREDLSDFEKIRVQLQNMNPRSAQIEESFSRDDMVEAGLIKWARERVNDRIRPKDKRKNYTAGQVWNFVMKDAGEKLKTMPSVVSLDAPLSETGNMTRGDTVAAKDRMEDTDGAQVQSAKEAAIEEADAIEEGVGVDDPTDLKGPIGGASTGMNYDQAYNIINSQRLMKGAPKKVVAKLRAEAQELLNLAPQNVIDDLEANDVDYWTFTAEDFRNVDTGNTNRIVSSSPRAKDPYIIEQVSWMKSVARALGIRNTQDFTPAQFTQLARYFADRFRGSFDQGSTALPENALIETLPEIRAMFEAPQGAAAAYRDAVEQLRAEFPGAKISYSTGHNASAWYDPRFRNTLFLNPLLLEQELGGLTASEAHPFLKAVLFEEYIHAVEWQNIPRELVMAIAQRLSAKARQRVIDSYVGSVDRFASPEARQEVIDSLTDESIGSEYIRMMVQRMRNGLTTEDLDPLSLPQNLLEKVMQVVKALIARLNARLQVARDPVLAHTIRALEGGMRVLEIEKQFQENPASVSREELVYARRRGQAPSVEVDIDDIESMLPPGNGWLRPDGSWVAAETISAGDQVQGWEAEMGQFGGHESAALEFLSINDPNAYALLQDALSSPDAFERGYEVVTDYMKKMGWLRVVQQDGDRIVFNGVANKAQERALFTSAIVDEKQLVADNGRRTETIYEPPTGGPRFARPRGVLRDIVTPEQDAAYAEAVKRGDMETAQRMVDEAAKVAGYNRKGVRFGFYVNGVPLPPSRNAELNFGTGYYVAEGATMENTTSSSVSVSPTANPSELQRLGLKPEDVEFRRDTVFVKAEKPLRSEYGGNLDKETADFINAQLAHDSAVQEARRASRLDFEGTSWGKTVSDLIASGKLPFDSVQGMTGRKGMSSELVVQKASQIKSADPVTRDDQGQIIPLSERFNTASNDIRFARPGVRIRGKRVGGKVEYKPGGLFSSGAFTTAQRDIIQKAPQKISKARANAEFLLSELRRAVKKTYGKKPAPTDLINQALGSTDNKLTDQQVTDLKKIRDKDARELQRLQYMSDNREVARIAQSDALAQLPDAVAKAVGAFGAKIDELSVAMKEGGYIPDDLIPVFDENLGLFIHRSYAIFESPLWKENMIRAGEIAESIREIKDTAERQKALSELPKLTKEHVRVRVAFERFSVERAIAEYATEIRRKAKQNNQTLTRQQAIALAKADPDTISRKASDLVLKYLAVADQDAYRFFAQGRRIPGRRDMDIIKVRGQVPKELREFWGEIKNAETNFTQTVSKMAAFMAHHDVATELLNNGITEGFIWKAGISKDPNPRPEWVPLIPKGLASPDTISPLYGAYGPKELQQALVQMTEPQAAAGFYRFMSFMTVSAMAMKTVGYVPRSFVRNFLGNPLIALGRGLFNLSDPLSMGKALADGFRVARLNSGLGGNTAYQARRERALELGVIGDNVRGTLLKKLYEESTEGEKIAELLKRSEFDSALEKIGVRTGQVLVKGLSKLADIYQGVDDIWKMYAWDMEQVRQKAAHPTWSKTQVEEAAAQNVRNLMPTYSLSPEITQRIRRVPVFAPFITWTSEMLRTTGNNLVLGKQEIEEGYKIFNKSGVPDQEKKAAQAMIRNGAARLGGFLAAVTVLPAFAMAMKAAFGYDDDDEEAVRTSLPEWQKNNQLIFLGSKDEGKASLMDLSYLDPNQIYAEPTTAAVRAFKKGENPLTAWAKETLKPLFSEQLFIGAMADVMRNRTADGRPIVNEQDTTANQLMSKVLHVTQAIGPGTLVATIPNMIRGAKGEISRSSKVYSLQDEIYSAAFGQKMSEVDAQTSLRQASGRFMSSNAEATRLLSDTLLSRGTIDVEDIPGAYENANRAKRELFQELRNNYNAALQLGVPRGQAVLIMRSSNISQDMVSQVVSDRYVDYAPIKQTLKEVITRPDGKKRVAALRNFLLEKRKQDRNQNEG